MKYLNKRSPFSSSRPCQSCAHSLWTAEYYSNCAYTEGTLLHRDLSASLNTESAVSGSKPMKSKTWL